MHDHFRVNVTFYCTGDRHISMFSVMFIWAWMRLSLIFQYFSFFKFRIEPVAAPLRWWTLSSDEGYSPTLAKDHLDKKSPVWFSIESPGSRVRAGQGPRNVSWDNHVQLEGVWGTFPRNFLKFCFKMVWFWGTLDKFARCQTDFLKRVKVAKCQKNFARCPASLPSAKFGTWHPFSQHWNVCNLRGLNLCDIQ